MKRIERGCGIVALLGLIAFAVFVLVGISLSLKLLGVT